MHQENLDLSKGLARLLQEGFSDVKGAFKSALNQVGCLYPHVQISRDRVRFDQAMKDAIVVYLMD